MLTNKPMSNQICEKTLCRYGEWIIMYMWFDEVLTKN